MTAMTSEREAMLPCPFCGGDERPDLVTEYPQPMSVVFAIECNDCGGRTAWCATSDLAERKWNRRAHLSQPAQAVDDEPIGLFAECYVSESHLKNLREVGMCFVGRVKSDQATIPLFTMEALTAALTPKDSR